MNKLVALAAQHKSVAVVGMAKNTGKTMTVNYLADGAMKSGLRLGLTSTGRDGETLDTVTALPKPAIHLTEGAVIATAAGSLAKGSSKLEILETTGISNTLGEIVLARVREAGTVEISGPERTQDLRVITRRLLAFADIVLVDGALDRMAASAPSVTEACILATGAVIGADVQAVVRSTVHCARVLLTPVVEPSLPAGAAVLVETGKIGVVCRAGAVKQVPLPTAVDAPLELLTYLDQDYSRLLLGGALTDELAELLISAARRIPGLEAIVRDGTRIFVEPGRWQRLLQAGAVIRCIEPVNLVALTVNPVDPRGRRLPGQQLVDALQDLLPDLLVLNPLAEGGV